MSTITVHGRYLEPKCQDYVCPLTYYHIKTKKGHQLGIPFFPLAEKILVSVVFGLEWPFNFDPDIFCLIRRKNIQFYSNLSKMQCCNLFIKMFW